MKRARHAHFLALLSALYLTALSLPAATTLLPFGSTSYYFDFGYQPPSDWAQPDFDNGDWRFGTAPFGYGNGTEETVVSFGPDDENKFITTYFRTYVLVPDPADFATVTFNLLRDDGAVVYLNGSEIFRDNLPDGDISYGSLAINRLTYPAEAALVSTTVSASLLTPGYNLVAVEVHQFEAVSPDLSFNLQIIGNQDVGPPTVTRGPYLQVGTSSNLVVRWRTSAVSDTGVRYGTNLASLNLSVSNAALVTEHEILLPGLQPETKYFYSIGTSTQSLAGDATYFFHTSPPPGPARPTRIWTIGDFGTGFPAQHSVRDAYTNFTGSRPTDVWLMLGDNAYSHGFDYQYQSYVFNIYPTLLRQTVVWPTMGNHETGFGSQILTDDYDYYRIFTMPTNGQAGGVASGTEHFYSFDYANIHFVCLDSMTAAFRQPAGVMAQWLQADLGDTTADWIIAYFHHPPYTKGSHNSDGESDLIQMRENILPILESFGVDLVLSGHSHSYERSFLLNGFYGYSSTASAAHFINDGDGQTNGTGAYLKPAGGLGANQGAVYVVNGRSGGQGGGGALNHPAMFYSTLTAGSLVLDIDGLRLDARYVSETGTVDDSFTLIKGDFPGTPRPEMKVARAGTNAVITWPTSIPDYQLEAKPSFAAPEWNAVGGPLSTNGRRKTLSVPATEGQRFFQLRRAP